MKDEFRGREPFVTETRLRNLVRLRQNRRDQKATKKSYIADTAM